MKENTLKITIIASILLTAIMLPTAMGQAKGKLDPRVEKALKKVGYKYAVTSLNNYRLTFDLPDKRSHLVFVSSQTVPYETMEVRKVWAVAYKTKSTNLSVDLANRLLRLNVKSRLGAWEYSTRKDGNRLKYVIRVDANCSAEDLKSAITAALHTADRMEKSLTKGKDEF